MYEIPQIVSNKTDMKDTLVSLSLSGHRISTILSDAFFGVPNLKRLNISYGNLQDIDPQAFISLTKLEVGV